MSKPKFDTKKIRKDAEIPFDQRIKKQRRSTEDRCSCGGRIWDEDNQLCYECSQPPELFADTSESIDKSRLP